MRKRRQERKKERKTEALGLKTLIINIFILYHSWCCGRPLRYEGKGLQEMVQQLKNWLLFQKIQHLLLASTWQLKTMYKPTSKWSEVLFWPSWALHTCASKSPIDINGNDIFFKDLRSKMGLRKEKYFAGSDWIHQSIKKEIINKSPNRVLHRKITMRP